jgi:hypothetical protein
MGDARSPVASMAVAAFPSRPRLLIAPRLLSAPRGLLASRPEIKKNSLFVNGCIFYTYFLFLAERFCKSPSFFLFQFFVKPHSLPYEDPSHATES